MRSRYRKLVVALIAVISMIPLAASPASAQMLEWRGEVIRIADGDTFDIRLTNGTVQTIRVAGINTNETSRDPKCWADEATDRLDDLIMGRTVKLQARDANSRLQGRPYRHVFLGRTNIAEKMVKEGYGLPFLASDEWDYAEDYTAAFYVAHDAGLRIHDDDACGVGPEANISFFVNGDADGSDIDNPNGEYFQIRNHATTTLSLRDWTVHDSAVDYWEFPNSASIPPGGVLTVHAGHGTDTSSHLYMGFDKQLYGPYDGAFLLDPDGDMRAFHHWPCDGFCGDSPLPEVVIDEVQADGPGNDNDNPNVEWVRIVNRDDQAVDLQDWTVTSHPYVLHITDSHVLQPGETATVFVGEGTDTRTELYWGKTASILGKDGDAMALWTPDGDVADCWAWGDSEKCGEAPSIGYQSVSSDFDGDGYDDIAIGVPKDDKKKKNSGSVLVVPGAETGVDRGDSKLWSQAGAIDGAPDKGDNFGSTVAVGDFNGDGYDDLAAGVPNEDTADRGNSGAANVIYGSRKGLRKAGDDGLRQANPEAGDAYGSALAAGDFNGDGYEDLAVGSPGENGSAGQVDIHYGSASGFATTPSQIVNQSGPESGDKFGAALTAGDVNGDGHDDLVIAAPGENANTGQVDMIEGSGSGLGGGGAVVTSRPLMGGDNAGDKFGDALASGDIDGDGNDDVVIGAPGADVSGANDAGSATVVFGTANGLDTAYSPVLSQANLTGSPDSGDRFGSSVAVGDIDGDRIADIVIGVPREDRSGRSDAGLVHVIYGDGGRSMTANRERVFDQSNAGGSVERGNRFGAAVSVLDVNGDNRGDIVVGATHDDVSGRKNHGSVGVIFGRSAGFSPPRGGLSIDQTGSVAGSPKKADLLGSSLS